MNLYESPCGYYDGITSKEEIYVFPSEKELEGFVPDEILCASKNRFGKDTSAQEFFYAMQLEQGFRRTGTILYRETCPECKKCIPIRIPVKQYQPNKTARRLLRKNANLELRITDACSDFITEEKILLYKNYWRRHNPDKTISYKQALKEVASISGCWDEFKDNMILPKKGYSGTKNFDYYLNGSLIAVSVLDFALDSISSNYFYYDISEQILKLSPGTFSIVNEIIWAALHGFEYYYLGYWIQGHPKMNYKATFFPHELYKNSEWKKILVP